jgi:ferredoxin-nitrite reductase
VQPELGNGSQTARWQEVRIMGNPVEAWKAAKHGFDVWPDVERYAAHKTPMKAIDAADLERMKWYGFFYRKRDDQGRYMVRIRVTANELNADQARQIAYIAYEFGHGIVDITTRANIQVQGLLIEHLPEVRKRLESVGLTSQQTGHDNIRNVFGHPFSGLTVSEVCDTRPLCHAVTAVFLGNRLYSDLPRKVNIAFSGAAQHAVHYWTQDVSFLAFRRHDGAVRFHVLLGGNQGQNPSLAWFLPVQVAAEQVVPLTRAVLDFYRTHGNRQERNAARLRYLVQQVGVSGTLRWLEEHLPFALEPCSQPPEAAVSPEDFVGWFPQSLSGLWTMGVNVPLGRLSWQQLEGLAVLSRKWGDGQLRTTYEQGIAVINIRERFKDAAATDAAALGLSVYADAIDRNCMACTGAQFCNIAVTETKGHMFRLMQQLRRRSVHLHNIRIHMSGCPSSCAQHFTADIGLKGVRVRRLLGTREGFDVFLGGGLAGQVRLAVPYRLGVDPEQLPHLIEEVVREYYLRRRPGETFSSYWHERLLQQEARKVLEDEYRRATWVCQKCQYQHQGEDPPMFCPQCASLRRHFARLEGTIAGESSSAKPSLQESSQDDLQNSQPSLPARRADGFYAVTTLDQLQAGNALAVEVEGQSIAVYRIADEVFATEAHCPHEGAPLAQGELQARTITCPMHQWTFDLCTGCSLAPAGHRIKTFPVRVVGREIHVQLLQEGS